MPRNGSGVSIFKSDAKGLWVARIELPPRNGDRRRKEVTAKTHELLLQKLRGPLKHYHLTGDLPTSSWKLETFLEYWFENVALKNLRPNTAAGYKSVLWTHVIPEIGHVRLDKLTTAHLRRVYTRITSTEKGKHEPPVYLSSTYALNAHRVLSAALTDAERDGLIPRNPATLMDAPRKSIKQLDALTVEEAKRVISLAVIEFGKTGDGYNPGPARWATYLLTGARRGEILGLEIDRVTNVLELSWQLQRVPNIETAPTDYEYRHIAKGMYWTRPKSSAGWRVIPLVEPLRTILEQHMSQMQRNGYGLVFASSKGLPIDPDTETELWARAVAGITDKHVRLHDARHTTVDLLYEAGVPEDIIMEIVGQSTRSVTRGYKSPANMKRREDAMLQLSAFLGYEPKRL